jgi:hypothetical protein
VGIAGDRPVSPTARAPGRATGDDAGVCSALPLSLGGGGSCCYTIQDLAHLVSMRNLYPRTPAKERRSPHAKVGGGRRLHLTPNTIVTLDPLPSPGELLAQWRHPAPGPHVADPDGRCPSKQRAGLDDLVLTAGVAGKPCPHPTRFPPPPESRSEG